MKPAARSARDASIPLIRTPEAPKTLPAETPIVSDHIKTAPVESAQISPGERKRRRNLRINLIGGVILLAAIGFLFLPKSWVTPAAPLPQEVPQETGGEVDAIRTQPPPPAKDPEEWVKTAIIGGVRPDRIIINGKVYKQASPIPPFGVRWMGRQPGKLIFNDSAGTELTRPYAQ